MRNTFEFDLKLGEKYENEFMAWAVSNGLTVVKMQGLFSEYDIVVTDPDTNESLTVEMKSDRQAIRTGRVALELKRWKNGAYVKSGLSISTASTFVFKLIGVEGFYSIPTTKLKELLKDTRNYSAIFTGEKQNIYTALFPKDFFLQQCKHIT